MKHIQNTDCELFMIENFKTLIKEYKNFSIKYEYNQQRRRLLVSYISKDYIFNNEDLLQKINKIEDKIKFKFNNYPLFCYDEDLFKLSNDAKELNYDNISSTYVSD